jgi:hypothetical protein
LTIFDNQEGKGEMDLRIETILPQSRVRSKIQIEAILPEARAANKIYIEMILHSHPESRAGNKI